ncbi:hypothetical protein ACFWPK_28605 [Nocardia sp. NPDC058519]|uniref:hypothetical protein n=1 Tax=Nocardia sp. NPDC058519 TaxID=3346535 RepID=UPI00364DAA62
MLKKIATALGVAIDAFTIVLYHAFLITIGAFGVFLMPTAAGIILLVVAIGLAVLYWTTGWMFFIG